MNDPERSDVPAVRIEDAPIAVRDRLTVEDVVEQRELIKAVMQQVMVKGVHYGVIPGCQKPSLLQPGAEVLCATFRLAPEYTHAKEWEPERRREWEKKDRQGKVYKSGVCEGFIRYEVRCHLLHGPTGIPVAEGVGVANNFEPKFISRDPYEIEETILQFARKRALVNAARTGTAASDIFTQDIEDMGRDALNGKHEPSGASPSSGPHRGPASGPPASPTGSPATTDPLPEPHCPLCRSKMWDNRDERAQAEKDYKAGTRKKKPMPAAKCMDKKCNGVLWTSADVDANIEAGRAMAGKAAPEASEPETAPSEPRTVLDAMRGEYKRLRADIVARDDLAMSANEVDKQAIRAAHKACGKDADEVALADAVIAWCNQVLDGDAPAFG